MLPLTVPAPLSEFPLAKEQHLSVEGERAVVETDVAVGQAGGAERYGARPIDGDGRRGVGERIIERQRAAAPAQLIQAAVGREGAGVRGIADCTERQGRDTR